MAAVLTPLSQLSPRTAPTFARPSRGGLQYMSKHFAHPEVRYTGIDQILPVTDTESCEQSFPLMLSLGVGTVGCYLGLEAITKQSAPAQTRPWSWKNYRLGLTEKSVDEVMFSIGV